MDIKTARRILGEIERNRHKIQDVVMLQTQFDESLDFRSALSNETGIPYRVIRATLQYGMVSKERPHPRAD